jgi:hypothetical protein
MKSSTGKVLNRFWTGELKPQEIPRPDSPSPESPFQNNPSPAAPRTAEDVYDPSGLLKRGPLAFATFFWHSQRSLQNKGTLKDLRKYKKEQEKKKAKALEFLAVGEQEKLAKLQHLLASKKPPMITNTTVSSSSPILAPIPVKPVRAAKRLKI